jgi:LmbE family N-acetylglucosaminyl deacetylase
MTKIFDDLNPNVVLAVAAHPDDIDVTCSGTMAKFAKDGAKVYYLILTDGSKGSDDKSLTPAELTKIRRQEQTDAAKSVGAETPIFFDYIDGELEITMALKKQIVKVIRQLKPEVVITMDPTIIYSLERGMINHPDHRAAGQATLDALFPLSRDHLAFPDLLKEGLEPHKVRTILLTNFEEHNYSINISDCMDSKFEAISAHTSQFSDPERLSGWMKEQAAALGVESGYLYAEGFKRIDLMY